MREYALTFVIVCRCGTVFEADRSRWAWTLYATHVPTCAVKTEAWSGWSFREVP